VHAISSRDRRKRAELKAAKEGWTLLLHNEGENSPYYQGCLQEMLLYSEGRPWQMQAEPPANVEVTAYADRLCISGALRSLDFAMELAFDEHQLLKLKVSWTNGTVNTIREAAVGLLLPLPRRTKEIVTIPHMLYNNNPSSDPERVVPRLGVGEGRGFICEEHRLPIPCVNLEWTEDSGSRFFSFFSEPDYLETPEGTVHYGSLGAIQEDERNVVTALSGVLMFNGEKDRLCISKNKTDSYTGGYLDFPPGFTLSKEYALDWGIVGVPGRGFREIVRKGQQLLAPEGAAPLTLDAMIRLKTNALDDRWRTDATGAAGYVKFSDSNAFGNVSKHPLHYMYGWTGQCLKLAWCDAKLGLEQGEEERVARCVQAVQFYVNGSRTDVPGLRHSSYRLNDGQWTSFRASQKEAVSSRALGETIADVADIILLLREHGREAPAGWIEALCEAADFFLDGTLPSGIYPAAWLMDGQPAEDTITAAGLPCLMALVKTYKVTGKDQYLANAETIMQKYYELHAESFERPFARSTLDAKCEDKEAGMYFFLAAYELLLVTKRERYSEWAELAADWLLTFVYMWNPVYNQGSAFQESGFRAVGWPGVSVQNHHLDVFFPSFELWSFGRWTGKPIYEQWGRTILGAMGQGICTKPGEWGFTVIGEQGEGFFQTHWNHRGHSNKWNPSWVIALVLQNALRLREQASEYVERSTPYEREANAGL
jgi:hypothetical protein